MGVRIVDPQRLWQPIERSVRDIARAEGLTKASVDFALQRVLPLLIALVPTTDRASAGCCPIIRSRDSGALTLPGDYQGQGMAGQRKFTMPFEPMTIEHLGLRLYSTLPPVLSELVSNAFDAESRRVEVTDRKSVV